MRIVDHDTFIELPTDVLYREYTPYIFNELKIKGDTVSNINWVLQDLSPIFEETFEITEACERLEQGESLTINLDCGELDSMFEYDRKFLIYEKKDIQKLINVLQKLL